MKLFRSVRPAPSEAEPGRELRLYQSETAEILEGPEPLQARLTLFVLFGLFVSVVLVSSVMRIDRVVSSLSGVTVTVEPTIVLGALDQSIIKTLDVREGDRVPRGQVVATLDPTFASADVGALRAQIASLDAQIARAKAELAQQPFTMADGAPGATSYVAMQRELYRQRKSQFDAQLHAYDEQIAQEKATIAKYQNDQARFGDRQRISSQVEHMRAELAAAQVGSRLNLLAATDQKLEIMRNLEFDRNAVAENQHQLDATIANRAAFIQQWLGQTSQELVTAQGQRDTAVEQLSKATKHQDQVRLVAPEDAMVLKLAKLSVHSVLNQGDPLVYLAPLKSPLEAELHIAAREVGFIRVGDRVTIKLDPFDFVEHGTAEGKVRSISEGSFNTDDNNQPVATYYRVRVTLTDVALRNVPAGFRLVPGMTLSGDIHVGTRSLFMYLMRGVVRGFDESMREP
jgi:HlyD family secretion protein